MSIDNLHPKEEQPRIFEGITPEALDFMAREGYAHIRGIVDEETRQQICEGFDQQHTFNALQQLDLIENRQVYSRHNAPSGWYDFSARLEKTMKSASRGDPDFALWGHKMLYGVPPVTSDTFGYQDGTTFMRHLDDPDTGFPTQVIVNWRGSAKFKIFDDMESDEPRAVLCVEPGDAVILRGDEKSGGQLPHSIEEIQGSRIITAFYAQRDYGPSVRSSRYQQERNIRWGLQRKNMIQRIVYRLGQRALSIKPEPHIPESPDTRFARR